MIVFGIMSPRKGIVSLAIVICCINFETATLETDFTNSISLKSENIYNLHWKVDSSTECIHFAVEVRTAGWIGFGISRGLSGKMKNADIVIGWVDNKGKCHLKDYHGIGHVRPLRDINQDYKLTGCHEINGKTVLKFKRKLKTCDPNDVDIIEGTMAMIFSWGKADPIGNKDSMLEPHGWKHKGAKNLNLLNYVKERPLPADTSYFDLVQKRVKVPQARTTYHCQPFKISNLVKITSPQHIIEIAPLIQMRPEPLVHHMLLYACKDDFNESALSVSGHCHGSDMPPSIRDCAGGTTMFAWGNGGGSFRFPENVGLPIGTLDSVKYVVLSTHFDNPAVKKDFVDSSGLRLYYTSPRKYDAALLTVGANVSGSMIIPPKQKSWIIETYCPKECSMKIKNKKAFNGNSIKLFTAMPHAHMTGNRIWTTLVRDGKEIKEVFRIDEYNFRYQQTYLLEKPIEFRAGDELHTYCRYNTTDRKYATVGGKESTDEMCLHFFMYYPRLNFQTCSSEETLSAKFAARYGRKIRTVDEKITKNNDWTGLEWNSTMVKDLRNIYRSKSRNAITTICNGNKGYAYSTKLIPHPRIKSKLRRKKKRYCNRKRKW